MKRLRSLAMVNTVIIVLTLVSIAIIIYYSITIYNYTADENLLYYNLDVPDGYAHAEWDMSALAMFMVGFQNVYEGNLVILNIYAEAKQPKNYLCNLGVVMVLVTLLVTGMGISGYLAFGD